MSVLAPVRQPAHTGENRCLPCTAVNLAVAVLASAALVVLAGKMAALAFLAVGCLAIYLRGYLVPGTPALTRRYLPDGVLALFGKGATDQGDDGGEEPLGRRTEVSDAPDPMEAVFSTGVVSVPGGGDPRLTDEFRTAFAAEIPRLRDDRDRQRAALAAALDRDADEIAIDDSTGRPFAVEAGTREPLGRWVSEAALLADAAAAVALSEVAPEQWRDLSTAGRGRVLVGVRGLLEACPACGGPVRPVETVVESCCTERDVYAVQCPDCEARLLEVDPAGDPGETAG